MSQPEETPAPATWKPSGPASSVAAVDKAPKGDVYVKMKRGLVTTLVLQAIFVFVLGGAAIVAADTPRTSRLYWWACVIPAGFAVIALLAYRRGTAVRREGRWTREWEQADVKKNYQMMGAVLLVWMLGLVALIFFI